MRFFLTKLEQNILYCKHHHRFEFVKEDCTVKEALEYLASIAGYRRRNKDEPIGANVVWRGLKELNTIKSFLIETGIGAMIMFL